MALHSPRVPVAMAYLAKPRVEGSLCWTLLLHGMPHKTWQPSQLHCPSQAITYDSEQCSSFSPPLDDPDVSQPIVAPETQLEQSPSSPTASSQYHVSTEVRFEFFSWWCRRPENRSTFPSTLSDRVFLRTSAATMGRASN